MVELDIRKDGPVLISDRAVARAFKSAYGADASFLLRTIQEGEWMVEGASPDVRDLLSNTLHNDGRLYSRLLGLGPDDDRYHIEVKGLGGVYFAQAAEFGDSGPFYSVDDAEAWILENWNDNLVSGGRRYRADFSDGCRDHARPLPPLSPSQKEEGRKFEGLEFESDGGMED